MRSATNHHAQSSLPLFRVVSGATAPSTGPCSSALLAESVDPTGAFLQTERSPPLSNEDIIYGLLEVILARRKLQQKLGRMHA